MGRSQVCQLVRLFRSTRRTHSFANSAQSRERRLAARAALKEVSVGGVRPYDPVGHYGGEEFVIVARSCERSGAVVLTETILTSLRSLRTRTDRGPLSVTLRCGIAVSGAAKPIEPQDLRHMADEALYRAKGHRRDRPEFAEEPLITPSTWRLADPAPSSFGPSECIQMITQRFSLLYACVWSLSVRKFEICGANPFVNAGFWCTLVIRNLETTTCLLDREGVRG
jgi:hypothetical protein